MCKQVTQNILVTELYGMTHGFDIRAVIKVTLGKFLQVEIPLVFYTDLKFLYDFPVKLETNQGKNLMIDVMSLRQSYKRRKVTEIKWMYGYNNLADLMSKSKASSILKTVIDMN